MSIQLSEAVRVDNRSRTADDYATADHGAAGVDRDFACLVSVTHLAGGDERTLRRVPGVTGVIDSVDAADVHMIVTASGPRGARRACVERVAQLLPAAVVTVPEVVDYNHALLAFLEQQGRHPDDPADSDEFGWFDDAQAVAEVLDRA
ncbi:MAG: hypothetical protein U0R64_11235 [Candidatus Nanopelagicales bacterium]